jgi:hypothetical protein
MEKEDMQQKGDRENAGGIGAVNTDKYTADAERDQLIPKEEDTARVRSEAQSVRDAERGDAE